MDMDLTLSTGGDNAYILLITLGLVVLLLVIWLFGISWSTSSTVNDTQVTPELVLTEITADDNQTPTSSTTNIDFIYNAVNNIEPNPLIIPLTTVGENLVIYAE